MSNDTALRFAAQVAKIQTLVDGGVRLSLDLVNPVDTETIVRLFSAKQPGIILECAAVAVKVEQSLTNGEAKTNRRAAGSPIDVAGG